MPGQQDPAAIDGSSQGTVLASHPMVSYSIPARQRDPQTFAGLRDEYVEGWLTAYTEQGYTTDGGATPSWPTSFSTCATLERFGTTTMRTKLSVFDTFNIQIKEIVGIHSDQNAQADKELTTRIQQAGEGFTSFIEAVSALCRREDKNMTEAERVRHLLKKISEVVFQVLLASSPTTVKEVVSECQRLLESVAFAFVHLAHKNRRYPRTTRPYGTLRTYKTSSKKWCGTKYPGTSEGQHNLLRLFPSYMHVLDKTGNNAFARANVMY